MSGLSIGWGEHSPWGVGLAVALIAEAAITAGLLATILSATSVKAPAHQAPFTIGLALTMLVMIAIPFTNGALNPARATGTAVFAEAWALGQLWAWWVAPLAGAALVGLAYRMFGPPEDLDTVQMVDAVTED
jgi:aquaporin Z